MRTFDEGRTHPLSVPRASPRLLLPLLFPSKPLPLQLRSAQIPSLEAPASLRPSTRTTTNASPSLLLVARVNANTPPDPATVVAGTTREPPTPATPSGRRSKAAGTKLLATTTLSPRLENPLPEAFEPHSLDLPASTRSTPRSATESPATCPTSAVVPRCVTSPPTVPFSSETGSPTSPSTKERLPLLLALLTLPCNNPSPSLLPTRRPSSTTSKTPRGCASLRPTPARSETPRTLPSGGLFPNSSEARPRPLLVTRATTLLARPSCPLPPRTRTRTDDERSRSRGLWPRSMKRRTRQRATPSSGERCSRSS
jgi:hypothetical protein